MPAKGTIKPDHIGLNSYQFLVTGLPPLTVLAVSGIEEELETVDLPDRTTASGGNTKAIEFEIKIPMHHGVEVAAAEGWFREGQDPVSPTYKKTATLVALSGTKRITRSYSILGAYLAKRALPEFAMENEGEMAVVTYTVKADDLLPL